MAQVTNLTGEAGQKRDDFLLQEHSLLRSEVSNMFATMRAIERDVVIAVGVIWGFLLAHPVTGEEKLAWWSPVLFTILGIAKAWTTRTAARRYQDYLCRIEEAFAASTDLDGMERFWRRFDRKHRFKIRSARIFWIILVAATMAVAIHKTI